MSYSAAGTQSPLAWRWIALESALLFIACTAIFAAALASTDTVLEGDTLFHWKMARLILERGPWVSIEDLPYTVLGAHGPDQHWLFHVLLAPFTLLGDTPARINFAAAMVCAAMPALFLPLLRRNLVPFAPVVCLLMVTASELLPYRFLSLRGQNFAVVMMVAMMFAILSRRRWWVGLGAFAFMQGYHAAVILGIFCALLLAADRLERRPADWKTVLAVVYGVALGLLLSPWFPDNVRYLVFHTVFKVAQSEGAGSGLVGTEWYLPSWRTLAVQSAAAHVLFFGMLAVAGWMRWRGRLRWSHAALVASGATLVFLAMYKTQGVRFGEYYVPFAVLAAALLWRDCAAAVPESKRHMALYVPGFAAVALMGVLLAWQAYYVSGLIRPKVRMYEQFMAYVEAHDPHPMVFDSQWWDYVVLSYHARNAKFVAGLDGHFLKLGDAERFNAWYSIIRGGMRGSPLLGATIHDRFDARWVVIGNSETGFAQGLSQDRNTRLVAEDEDGWLFEVKADGAAW